MPTDPTAIIFTLLTAALSGALGIVVTLLMRKGDRHEHQGDRLDERTNMQGVDLAKLQANVSMLVAQSDRCEQLAHRTSKLEGWQELMKPRIDEAHEGLRAVARLDERMRTVFSMLERIQHTLSERQGQGQGHSGSHGAMAGA